MLSIIAFLCPCCLKERPLITFLLWIFQWSSKFTKIFLLTEYAPHILAQKSQLWECWLLQIASMEIKYTTCGHTEIGPGYDWYCIEAHWFLVVIKWRVKCKWCVSLCSSIVWLLTFHTWSLITIRESFFLFLGNTGNVFYFQFFTCISNSP